AARGFPQPRESCKDGNHGNALAKIASRTIPPATFQRNECNRRNFRRWREMVRPPSHRHWHRLLAYWLPAARVRPEKRGGSPQFPDAGDWLHRDRFAGAGMAGADHRLRGRHLQRTDAMVLDNVVVRQSVRKRTGRPARGDRPLDDDWRTCLRVWVFDRASRHRLVSDLEMGRGR